MTPARQSMPAIRSSLFAVAIVVAATQHADAQHFSLDDVMSAPFASDLVAAPRGGSVAWIVNQRGARNIWVGAGPSWQGRQLTSYREDDGQEIESLAFRPDGKAVVYVRGGPPNRAGERPNPSLIPGGVDQAMWIMPIDGGGVPRKIAEGSSPQLSPSGDSIAFVRAGQIWIGSVRADAAAPTQLTKLRGGSSGLRWSPDGKRLAFVSNRQRHSFIGVWDFASRSLRYMDPSTDEDGAAVWSPDGRALAFIRAPSTVSDLIFVPERESPIPWSIRVADPNTGASREVWRAKKGPGSVFREIVADDQLFWSAGGDRIVFPWEADGWTHLYSVARTGGAPVLLTSGAFEVEYLALRLTRVRSSTHQTKATSIGDIYGKWRWMARRSLPRSRAEKASSGIRSSPATKARSCCFTPMRVCRRAPRHSTDMSSAISRHR